MPKKRSSATAGKPHDISESLSQPIEDHEYQNSVVTPDESNDRADCASYREPSAPMP